MAEHISPASEQAGRPFVAGTASPADVDTASLILGRAFVDDPMFTSTLRDPVRRAAGLPLAFRALCRQFVAGGALDVVERDGRPVGAAVWADGNQSDIGLRECLTTGQVRFGMAAGVRDALRLMRLQNRITAVHHELVPGPHVYLLLLGVLPEHQGSGVGSELLDRGLAWIDSRHQPAYLETNLEQNARLYQRKGFETARVEDGGGFRTWFMVRPAR